MDLTHTGTRLAFAIDLQPGDRVVDCPFVTVAYTVTHPPVTADGNYRVTIHYAETTIPVTVDASAMFDVIVPEGYHPLTDDEFTGIMGQARAPYPVWVAQRALDAERRHRILLQVEALYRETPWYCLGQRFRIRRALNILSPKASH